MNKILCFFSAGIMMFGMFDIFKTKKALEEIVHRSVSSEGTVESIHIGGRTEVVKVTGVNLTKYLGYCNKTTWGRETCLWRLEAEIVQPDGRIGYFAPHLNGIIDVKQKAGQLTEFGENPWDTLNDMIRGWNTFRFANIAFKDGKPVAAHFSHLKFSEGKWIMVASYTASF